VVLEHLGRVAAVVLQPVGVRGPADDGVPLRAQFPGEFPRPTSLPTQMSSKTTTSAQSSSARQSSVLGTNPSAISVSESASM
jgi:hypothetical protein